MCLDAEPGHTGAAERLAALFEGLPEGAEKGRALSTLLSRPASLSAERRGTLSVRLARASFADGDLAAAESRYGRALAEDVPPSLRASWLVGRAEVLVARKEITAALEDLEDALSLEPESPAALALQGELAYRTREWAEARRAYDALEANPRSVEVIAPALLAFRRAELAEVFGDEELAERCYRQVAALDPRHVAAREALAQFAAFKADHEAVVRWLGEVLALLPIDAVDRTKQAREGLGRAYLALGQAEAAREHLQIVLSEEPDRLTAIEVSARAEEVLGEHRKAAELWSRLARLYPEPLRRAEALYRQGEAFRMVGDDAAANDAYLRSADMDPGLAPTMVRLVGYYWARGDLAGVAGAGAELAATDAGRAALADEDVALMIALGAAAGTADDDLAEKVLPRPLPHQDLVLRRVCDLARSLGTNVAQRFDKGFALLARHAPEGFADVFRENLRARLHQDPGDRGALSAYGRLCENARCLASARAAYSLLGFLAPEDPFAARIEAIDRTNAVPDAALAKHATEHPQCAGPLRRALERLVLAVPGLEGPAAEPWPAADEALAANLERFRVRLGAPVVAAWGAEGASIEIEAGRPTVVRVGRELKTLPAPRVAFYLGVTLELIRSGTVLAERYPGEARSGLLLAALEAVGGALPEGTPPLDAGVRDAARALLSEPSAQSSLPEGSDREAFIADLHQALAAPVDDEAYVAGCRHTANRVGLLACGAPGEALRAATETSSAPARGHGTDPMIRAINANEEELARAGSTLRELALFMLSPEYERLVGE
jgi:tetratricopeptide (TPR) repeat protein